jgi:hypothetical protein
MKIIFAGLLVFFAGMGARGQFGGKLTYKIIRPTEILTMVYYESGNNARMDARMTSPTDTTQVLNTQDTMLFDIAGRKMTKMQYKTGMAFITVNTATLAMAVLKKSINSVQTVGPETVNGYACTHYILSSQTGNFVTKRDLWITSSLGNPGVQVVGSFLYLTSEHPQMVALAQAGATGVVVKCTMKATGVNMEMNLVGVDQRRLPASTFQVPSRYTVVDRTNFPIPTQ